MPPPPLWSEMYKNSLQKRVFNNIFVILGVMAKVVANPELTLLKLIKIICSDNHGTICQST